MEKNIKKPLVKLGKGVLFAILGYSLVPKTGSTMEASSILHDNSRCPCPPKVDAMAAIHNGDRIFFIKKQLFNAGIVFTSLAEALTSKGKGTLASELKGTCITSDAIARAFSLDKNTQSAQLVDVIIALAEDTQYLYDQALAVEDLPDSVEYVNPGLIEDYRWINADTDSSTLERQHYQKVSKHPYHVHAEHLRDIRCTFLSGARTAAMQKYYGQAYEKWLKICHKYCMRYQALFHCLGIDVSRIVAEKKKECTLESLSYTIFPCILSFLPKHNWSDLCLVNSTLYTKIIGNPHGSMRTFAERLTFFTSQLVQPLLEFKSLHAIPEEGLQEGIAWIKNGEDIAPSPQSSSLLFHAIIQSFPTLRFLRTYDVNAMLTMDELSGPGTFTYYDEKIPTEEVKHLRRILLENAFHGIPKTTLHSPGPPYRKTILWTIGYAILYRSQLFEELKSILCLIAHAEILRILPIQKALVAFLEQAAGAAAILDAQVTEMEEFHGSLDFYLTHYPLCAFRFGLSYFQPIKKPSVRFSWIAKGGNTRFTPSPDAQAWALASTNLYPGTSVRRFLVEVEREKEEKKKEAVPCPEDTALSYHGE